MIPLKYENFNKEGYERKIILDIASFEHRVEGEGYGFIYVL